MDPVAPVRLDGRSRNITLAIGTAKTMTDHHQILAILVAEPDSVTLQAHCDHLGALGHSVRGVTSVDKARADLSHTHYDVVFLDLTLSGSIDLIPLAKRAHPFLHLVTVVEDRKSLLALERVRGDVDDYLVKELFRCDSQEILHRFAELMQFKAEKATLTATTHDCLNLDVLSGESPDLDKLIRLLRRAASAISPVLITGERGTGKQRVARWIHDAGDRAEAPYFVIECAFCSPSEMKAALFGGVSDYIVSESVSARGVLGVDTSTVVLRDVEMLPNSLQKDIVGAIDSRRYHNDLSAVPVPLTARILATTSTDLKRRADEGAFRLDLYRRLNIVNVHMPPLRERKMDIPLFIYQCLRRLHIEHPRGPNPQSPDIQAMQLFTTYDWPGNLTELERVLERAAVLCTTSTIGTHNLATSLQEFRRSQDSGEVLRRFERVAGGEIDSPNTGILPSAMSLADMERELIQKALLTYRDDMILTARALGIGRSTLYRKIKQYSKEPAQVRQEETIF